MDTEIGWKDSFLLRIINSVMSLPLPWMSSGGYLKFEYILREGSGVLATGLRVTFPIS